MLTDTYQFLYWKTNAAPLLGFAAGTLVCCEYSAGGGFAGAPEELTVAPVHLTHPDAPRPEPAEFPAPSVGVQYNVGGRPWGRYLQPHPSVLELALEASRRLQTRT